MRRFVFVLPLLLLIALPALALDDTTVQDQVPRMNKPVPPPPGELDEFGDLLNDPVLQLQFNEGPQNHTFGVAWDGEYYWTINGGNTTGLMNYYDADGNYVGTTNVQIDGRGIVQNPIDGNLYICSYTGDVYRIDDRYTDYAHTLVHDSIMQNGQASFGMSYDGSLLYDFNQGTVEVHDFFTGELLDTITGLMYYGSGNFGGECGIVADTDYLYTWDSAPQELYVYEMDGTYVTTYSFDVGNNGMGLSFCNNWVWLNDDSNYDVGTYYAYEIREWTDGPVQFSLIPQETVIPPDGGDVVYGVELVSEYPGTVPGLAFWTIVTIPNGQDFGPLTVVPFTHTPNMNVMVTNLVQSVPGLAPVGTYTFTGHIGFQPNPILSDDFEFEKLGAAAAEGGGVMPTHWPAGSRLQDGTIIHR